MITFLKNGNGLVPTDEWESNCWVNLTMPTEAEKDYIIYQLDVPKAFYEDIEDVDERPRVEIEDGWCFVLMRIPYREPEAESTTGGYNTVPLGIIFKDDIFVSVCMYKTEMLDDFIHYTRRKNIHKENSIDFIFRFLLSADVWFLKYLKQINALTRKAELQLESSIRNEDLATLHQLENCLVYFTTSLRGNEILTHRLKNIRGLKEMYDPDLVEDVEIESRQALETTNIYSDILSGMMDSYASVISNNLNIVMKRLTTISVVLMMPTLIASFFGMNLEIGSTIFNWTFYTAVGISILLTTIVTSIFVKKKWF